ncbi:MAG: T9SS type A sorting domain-containing protein [Bacteroidota bacterium]
MAKIAHTSIQRTCFAFFLALAYLPVFSFDDRTADSLSLLAFYEALEGENWKVSWDLNTPLDQWNGVRLSRTGRVIGLAIANNNLRGELPSELGNLTALQGIYLPKNQISGSIPTSIARNEKLERIQLAGNQITQIPEEIAALLELTFLDISKNQIDVLPDGIGQLLRLRQLNLSRNNISKIPTTIEQLTGLEALNLSRNPLSSTFPNVLLSLNGLKKLDLSNCGLNGAIPLEINNLTLLEMLSLHSNQLSGGLSNVLAFPHLKRLYLQNNELTGFIPTTITNLQQLKFLNLSHNQLNGAIPATIVDISNLRSIDFTSNQLSSDIPDDLDQLQELRFIKFGNNQLTGSLPSSLANLPHLRRLDVSNNALTGCFPTNFIVFCDRNLKYDFSGNDISITFEAFCEFGESACNTDELDCPRFVANVTNATEDNDDGAIQLNLQDGRPPFRFLWNTGDTTQNLENIPAGVYQVSITSATGCTVNAIYNELYFATHLDTMPLPDGTGSPFFDTIHIEDAADQMISKVAQVHATCANMEHSYLRDLEISLICPNGQAMILHDYPGRFNSSTVYLGEPIEEGAGNEVTVIPGVGYDYCWTPNAENGTWIEEIQNSTNLVMVNDELALSADDYAAYDRFSELVGCPITGDWVLKIEDLWASDNGTLFGWSVQFYDEQVQNEIVVGVGEVESRSLLTSHFEIYPSPSNGNLNLDIELLQEADLQVFDAQAQLIEQYLIPSGTHHFQKDFGHLKNGIYYLRLRSGKEIWSKKFVLAK